MDHYASPATYTSLLRWDVQGRRYRVQPPAQAEVLFAAANRAKRCELFDTGHPPYPEDPAAVAQLITEWLPGG